MAARAFRHAQPGGQRFTVSVKRLATIAETWLESQYAALPLWLPVAMGGGVLAWFVAGPAVVPGLAVALFGLCAAGWAVGQHRRAGFGLIMLALAMAVGLGAIVIRAAAVDSPPLAQAWTGTLSGRVKAVERIDARDVVRATVAVERTGEAAQLPAQVRVNFAIADGASLVAGQRITTRARLMPPAPPAVPGGYDFARKAWFERIGATGRALDPPAIEGVLGTDTGLRPRLTALVYARVGGDAGAIAATLATGDRSHISTADDAAMRASGMAHLLSISGLHVTAVAGAVFFILSRLLSLIGPLALRVPVPLLAAAGSAGAAVGYTLLTGAEVPTVRTCVAALLVLVALALGREPMTLRLVAVGAIVVLLLRPEALVGPSFQLSFAAVASIVILHESGAMRSWAAPREQGVVMRLLRGFASLLITGLVVELVLLPIALFHFHRTGLYGAVANMIAIPLTTFVIMPIEALALLLDWTGLAAPLWWLCGRAIDLLLWVAHFVTGLPGAVAVSPGSSRLGYGLAIAGGLWLGLIVGRARFVGLAVALGGFVLLLLSPRPDMLVTGDGRHVLVIDDQGKAALLRAGAGDYVRSVLAENAGMDDVTGEIAALPGARCSADMCSWRITRGGRATDILASRSPYRLPAMELAAACARADIVLSERWLPASCRPRWLKVDRASLAQTGGLSFDLDQHKIRSVAEQVGPMPWARFGALERRPRSAPPRTLPSIPEVPSPGAPIESAAPH